jgi:hypothetical protein
MNTVAQPPHSDGKQPAGEAHSSRRTLLAAPFPNPHAKSSQSCGNSASNAVTRVPPSLFEDPCLSAQLAMGIR